MFHANPWAHVRFNTATGQFEERENPYPKPESLYRLCDKEHVCEAFVNDFDVQAYLAQQGATDVNLAILGQMAEALEEPVDLGEPQPFARAAQKLLQVCALRSSRYIVENAKAFAQEQGKKLMLLLSYSASDVINACQGKRRFDQSFVDYLRESNIPFVDTLEKHALDFRSFSGSPSDYVKRYYIGHYNPQGNHFFAFAIKDAIVGWLDPKPPTYREEGPLL